MLSACDTRSGQTYSGEEAYGLADAFLARNAAAVVATLWSVETSPANAFSRVFYERVKVRADYTAAAAFAARSLLGGQVAEWTMPKHWAAYESVTGLFNARPETTPLVARIERRDDIGTGRVKTVLASALERAEHERDNLLQAEETLKLSTQSLENRDAAEAFRIDALRGQLDAAQLRQEWLDETMKVVSTARGTDPAWNPAKKLTLTVDLKSNDNEQKQPISDTEVVLAEDFDRSRMIKQTTDSMGKAVFRNIQSGVPYLVIVHAKDFSESYSTTGKGIGNVVIGGFEDTETEIVMWNRISIPSMNSAKQADPTNAIPPIKSKSSSSIQSVHSQLELLNDQDIANEFS